MNRWFGMACGLMLMVTAPSFAANLLCSYYRSREKQYHLQNQGLYSPFLHQEREVSALLGALSVKTIWSPEEQKQILEFEKALRDENHQVMERVAGALDRVAMQTLFAQIKDHFQKRIQINASLKSVQKKEMIRQIRKTDFYFPGDDLPFLSKANRLVLQEQVQNICGPGKKSLPQNAFSLSLEQRFYVVMCPGDYVWSSQSPLGKYSMVFDIAHEMAHSFSPTGASSDLPEPLPNLTFEEEHAPLLACWKPILGSELKSPMRIYKKIKDEKEKNAFATSFNELQEKLRREPDAIDMHSIEMIPDYWAIQVLKSMIKETPELSKNPEQSLKENLLNYCSMDSDDGKHLPGEIRLDWLTSDPEVASILHRNSSTYEWCQL